MNKLKLIMTKGLPASGKSTWANEYIVKNSNTKRVNKDDLRAMLDNSLWSKKNEEFVLAIRDYIIIECLTNYKYNVIVDDTNFAPKHEAIFREIAGRFNAEFEIKDFTDVSPEVCIERDLKRVNSVGSKVIMDMYDNFIKVKASPTTIPFNPNLPNCYIFDVDGTLALMNGRGPFDWNRVDEDLPNKPVISTFYNLSKSNANMFVFSGRDSVCVKKTAKWLEENGVVFDELVMRPEGDTRKDSIVKREMYDTHIKDKYNVLGIFDDRNQVVEMWRELGLPCYQVNLGDF